MHISLITRHCSLHAHALSTTYHVKIVQIVAHGATHSYASKLPTKNPANTVTSTPLVMVWEAYVTT